MRLNLLALLCTAVIGCAGPSQPGTPPGATALTWTGEFGGGPSRPGHVTLLLDEVGDRWTGSMVFETLPGPDGNTQRATYRIEGAPAPPEAERGALVHIEQSAILEGDPLPGGFAWCLGAYDLTLGEQQEALVGAYDGKVPSCGGTARLAPVD
jgi:hypothetical protein